MLKLLGRVLKLLGSVYLVLVESPRSSKIIGIGIRSHPVFYGVLVHTTQQVPIFTGSVQAVPPCWVADGFDPYSPGGAPAHHIAAGTLGGSIAGLFHLSTSSME